MSKPWCVLLGLSMAFAPMVAGQEAPSTSTTRKPMRLQVEVAAGGGFAGIREAEVQSQPRLICPETPGPCQLDPDNVVLARNKKYTWRPSLSTGIIFRFVRDTSANGLGLGIGGHFVFVPSGTESRAAPALTVHAGLRSMQVFLGMIFVPTDDIDFPGGADEIIAPAGTNTDALIRRDGGTGPSLFAGIVVGGIAVTK